MEKKHYSVRMRLVREENGKSRCRKSENRVESFLNLISMDFISWKKTMNIQQTFSSLNAGDTGATT